MIRSNNQGKISSLIGTRFNVLQEKCLIFSSICLGKIIRGGGGGARTPMF